jgi:hypothetical protein
MNFFGRQNLCGAIAALNGPRDHPRLASRAGSTAAAVWQQNARCEGGIQDAFIGIRRKLMQAGLNGDLERHGNT